VTQGATNLLDLDYTYGTSANNGNVLSQSITVKRSGLSDLVFDQTYTYDSLNRIKTAKEMTDGTETASIYLISRIARALTYARATDLLHFQRSSLSLFIG
jgi:hypothetical protein